MMDSFFEAYLSKDRNHSKKRKVTVCVVKDNTLYDKRLPFTVRKVTF